jgi:hypothetical protein
MRDELPRATPAPIRIAQAGPGCSLHDVIRGVDQVALSPPDDRPAPAREVLRRAKELILAVGPFTTGGPRKVLFTTSIRGGLVLTFVLDEARDVTFVFLNAGAVYLVLNKESLGLTEVPPEDLIPRGQALCRAPPPTTARPPRRARRTAPPTPTLPPAAPPPETTP